MEHKLDPHTRLQGRWLAVARGIWLVLVVLAIGIFVAGTPLRFTELQRPCADAPITCSNRLLPTTTEITELAKRGLSPQAYAFILTGFTIVTALVSWAVAVLIFARKSDDRGALIISLALVFLGANNAMWQALAEHYSFLQPLVQFLFFVTLVTFALLFALFPNGRVVPRAMWVVIGLWTLYALTDTFPSQALVTDTLADIAWTTLFLTGMAAQIYRYFWISTAAERKQTKWVVFGFALLVVFVMFAFVFLQSDPTYFQGVSVHRLVFQILNISVAICTIPVPIAIAILRNRLWDIDLLIRRTLQYSLLSGLLAFTYFGLIVVLQSLFTAIAGQRQNELVTVISTLVIAALFLPLRRRVQDVIDRRFYRKKYDAAKTLAAFAATCRDETDLDKLTARLVEVVNETMQPEHVSLWLKKK